MASTHDLMCSCHKWSFLFGTLNDVLN